MADLNPNSRHLAVAGIQRYLKQGVSGDVFVPGPPDAYLIIEAISHTVSIHVATEGSLPDLMHYEHLNADTVYWRQRHWLRLTVSTNYRFEDIYPLLCLVLDGVQLHGRSFAASINDALNTYRELLAQRASLSDTDQVGLVGELLILRRLIRSLGPSAAIDAWLGVEDEEHDFSLADIDIEVKTTSSERRQHWISSASQLEPKPGRPLYLVSIQITRSGAAKGESLPDLVAGIRREGHTVESRINQRIEAHGFKDPDADLYPTRWTPRNAPVAFQIDSSFPAITSDRLKTIVPRTHLINAVNYRLDLHNYKPSAPPEQVLGLLELQEAAK